MKRTLKGLSLFGGLAVVLTLFFVIGCSNYTPLQPDDPNPVELGRLDQKLTLGEEGKPLEVFNSKLIKKDDGGTIEIERDIYFHEFIIEPKAIEENTLITIRSINEEILGNTMILFDFGPDGLEFSESAILRFDMNELREDAYTARLYYYHPEEEDWVYQYSVEVQDDIAEFEIDHFSKYAISD